MSNYSQLSLYSQHGLTAPEIVIISINVLYNGSLPLSIGSPSSAAALLEASLPGDAQGGGLAHHVAVVGDYGGAEHVAVVHVAQGSNVRTEAGLG